MSLHSLNSAFQYWSKRAQSSIKELPAPVVAVSTALTISFVAWRLVGQNKRRPANAPPVVPHYIPYFGHGIQMHMDPAKFIAECRETYGDVFEIYSFGQALVVVTGKKIVECFRAGEEVLSFQEGVEDLLPVRHLTAISYDKLHQQAGPDFPMEKNPIIKVVRNNFKSHQISIYHDRMVDAIERCFIKDLQFKPGEDSTEIDASIVFQKMVARISSQVFAGEEYAENEALIDALASYALSMFRAGLVENILPRPMADYLVRHYLPLGQHISTTMDEVLPMVEEIKDKEEKDGQSEPTHFMHMMFHTPGADDHIQTPEEVAFWMKDIAFASIHTTSLFLGFALHDLSNRPDVQEILRNEVAEARAKHGTITPDITKDLPIMDSFLREALRLNSDYVGFRHKAMRDFVLSDGVLIPKGATVGLAVWDAHTNPEIQDIGENNVPLNQLDPYRFVGRRSKKSTSVGQDFLTFGVGHHACPGRFFASQEIRYLLACLLERYDIKASTASGKRAPNLLALGMVQLVPSQPLILTKRA